MNRSHLRSETKVNETAYSAYLKTLASLDSHSKTLTDERHIVEVNADQKYINELSYLQAAQLYYMQSNPAVIQFSASLVR